MEDLVMESLTRSLRHQHPDEVFVEVKGQGRVEGDTMYLHQPRRITHYNGVPDTHEIFTEMHVWLRECIEQRLIDP